MNQLVVSNSSPLIALDQLGHLDLMRRLFREVKVPAAVVREVSPQLNLPSWVVEQPLTQPLAPRVLAASLGPGESEAICLAIEQSATQLILDDLPARRLATVLGQPVVGTIGILVAAKQGSLLTEIRPLLDTLIQQHGFFVAPALYNAALKQVGEMP